MRYLHDYQLSKDKKYEICVKCGMKAIVTQIIDDSGRVALHSTHFNYGCISDNEAVIKKLLE